MSDLKQQLERELDVMIQNSFRNFHTKGFDYLCLKRTPEHTRKVYFFDGDVAQLPEVVSPHDHRYHFTTTILTGVMSNSNYVEVDEINPHADVYQEFEWRTPLNGGDGFTWKKETALFETRRFFYRPGEMYRMRAEDFHTIRMHADQTVLILDQYDDVVPVDQPTRTFMSAKQAPNMDGLYEKFTPDQLLRRLSQYHELLDQVAA